MDFQQHVGKRARVGQGRYGTLQGAQPTLDGWALFLQDDDGGVVMEQVPAGREDTVEVVTADGAADPDRVLTGLWAQWMRASTLDAKATVLATSPLEPYAHQNNAVYGAMLPQPRLRFLLADEPGTGKTVMAGMYLRESQRLETVKRALVVCPAHLVTKWQADFKRFFGGGLKRITHATVREGAMATDHDLWVVSLELASQNRAVQDAIHPAVAGWDVVVFDEAHRLTPTAETFYFVGRMLAYGTPQVLLMTATPHRGKEWLFRSLMNLVDPDLFPPAGKDDDLTRRVKPPATHFLRRMKEDLRDRDGVSPLFKGRTAHNRAVALSVDEAAFYGEALDMVERYFPANAVPLAKMVYGKRAASSLYSLAETLKRRRHSMGTDAPAAAAARADPEEEDTAEREEAEVVVEKSKSAKAERKDIDGLLQRLAPFADNPAASASKWPRLVDGCLAENGIVPGGTDQAVVFTEYADTADWLVRRLRHVGFTANRYSGRDDHPERDAVRDAFQRREFQVLVSTDAGNEGIDLQTAHVLVNWDIPWSLVRLEQRMGRIHRVGQTREVELYNLVATDTREGDVLQVLLENFAVAANQLDGKLFDSLELVAEMVDLDTRQILGDAFSDDPVKAAGALAAARAVTADRLRAVAEETERTERALSTQVDVAAAVAALQRETLERINPFIVEQFLDRLQAAGLFTVQGSTAGPGIFLVEPAEGGLTIGTGAGGTLVASSSTALDEAEKAGSDVTDVVALGPSDPPFRELVRDVAERLGADLTRGSVLVDKSSSTDYHVVCFEADVTESAGRRKSRWPFLVRADDVGAVSMAWEQLGNLEPAEDPAGPLHPAVRSDAEAQAARHARDEQTRRAEALGNWLTDTERQWERLPTALTADIDDRQARRRERDRITKAVERQLADLRAAAQVTVAAPRLLGWARVLATAPPPDPEERDSERIAVRHVTRVLRADGWAVRDAQHDGAGYDLLATRGRLMRCVEVKGVWESAASQGIRMIGHEVLVAQQQGDRYWLYVVDQCHDATGTLYGTYPDPAAVFADVLVEDTVVRVPGSALKSARTETVTA